MQLVEWVKFPLGLVSEYSLYFQVQELEPLVIVPEGYGLDAVGDETHDVLHFFTLPNTLDKPNIIQLLQCDTATYQLGSFSDEIVNEWKGIKKNNVRIRQIRKRVEIAQIEQNVKWISIHSLVENGLLVENIGSQKGGIINSPVKY